MPLSQGQILNSRYRIAKLLRQGGFGAVYRAWDLNINRPCAVKENLEASAEAQQQFGREAMILANLNHPNLARVNDYFFIPGQGQYLVMDYVEGEDLQEKLNQVQGPLPEVQVIPWILQICDALEYLHCQNPPIIHRDIKPANIRITSQGQAMLVDFGIAKAYDPNLKTTLGARAFTPGYSPPEQYGRGTTDARSDIYALGATLYTILTCEVPPESTERLRGAVLSAPSRLNPAISPKAEVVISRAMQLEPTQRFQQSSEFRAALHSQILPLAATSPQPSHPYSAPSGKSFAQLSTSVKMIILGVGLALMLACFGGGLYGLEMFTQFGKFPTASSALTTQPPATAAGTNAPPTEVANFNAVSLSSKESSSSGIQVEVLYADGSPKKGSWVEIYKQTVDISNNPLQGDHIAGQRTDASGAAFFELAPGTYVVQIGDYYGYSWGQPFNYDVKANTITVIRITLGRLIIGLRNASGQPLNGRWTGVSVQQQDLLGQQVRGDRCCDGRTNDAGFIVYDLTPGLYTVQIGDIQGEVWGEEMNHAIYPGQTTQIIVTLGKLVVGVVNADGQPMQGIWVGVSFQRQDVGGNPVRTDRFVDGRTNNTGAIGWDMTSGTYSVQVGDLRGYLWGDEMNHVITSSATTTILVELGRLTVGLKDQNGNPITGRWVGVYLQKLDVNGNIIKGDRIADAYTDAAGFAAWDFTAGRYVVEIAEINTLMDVAIEKRRTTFVDGANFEIR